MGANNSSRKRLFLGRSRAFYRPRCSLCSGLSQVTLVRWDSGSHEKHLRICAKDHFHHAEFLRHDRHRKVDHVVLRTIPQIRNRGHECCLFSWARILPLDDSATDEFHRKLGCELSNLLVAVLIGRWVANTCHTSRQERTRSQPIVVIRTRRNTLHVRVAPERFRDHHQRFTARLVLEWESILDLHDRIGVIVGTLNELLVHFVPL
ncbi:hypothetical protein UFOVP1290_152 [uncultured Caudovirales phage]|uniref:Uncharacterized protein n=1 Tax=uncultured Caudovirales phage TaxID=2100421 RepID=A0A6J5RKP9_9CAUD|nr:hypothetical protein UFOVP1290_152 [uncultured Caudovirales phage]